MLKKNKRHLSHRFMVRDESGYRYVRLGSRLCDPKAYPSDSGIKERPVVVSCSFKAGRRKHEKAITHQLGHILHLLALMYCMCTTQKCIYRH